MCNFIVHHKIGKKKPLTGLWYWYILRQCGVLVLIRFVENLQGIKVLRLEVIIAPSTLLLLFPFHRECYSNQRFLQGWFFFLGLLL